MSRLKLDLLTRSLFLLVIMVSVAFGVHYVTAKDNAVVDTTVRDMATVASDSQGNAYVAWREYKDLNKAAVVLQKIDKDGNRQWSREKTMIEPNNLVTELVHLSVDKDDNLYLSWAQRTSGTIVNSYMIQKFDGMGNPLWQEPMNFYSTKGDEQFYNLADVSVPRVDSQNNIHFAWTERDSNSSHLYYQVLNQRIEGLKFTKNILVAETLNTSAVQFYFLDLDIDEKNKSAYFTYLSTDTATPTLIGYNIVKTDFEGKKLWTKNFSIPADDDEFVKFISLPTLNSEGNLHLGWAINDLNNESVTQRYIQLAANGNVNKDQSIPTSRKHFRGIRSTSIVTVDPGSTVFATSYSNDFSLFRYQFGEQQLTQTELNLTRPRQNLLYAVNNWGIAIGPENQVFVAWSEASVSDDGAVGNYNIFVQKFTRNLAKSWGSGEKANSKRIAANTPVMTPTPKPPVTPPTKSVVFDSDMDGINNEDEVRIYGSNPYSHDTDNDGYPDGAEIQNGYNPVGICRPKKFQADVFAYGKGKLLHTDNIICFEKYLRNELEQTLTIEMFRSLTAQQWDVYSKAFIYGDYSLQSITASIRTGGHTVHPSINWHAWKETQEYKEFINK